MPLVVLLAFSLLAFNHCLGLGKPLPTITTPFPYPPPHPLYLSQSPIPVNACFLLKLLGFKKMKKRVSESEREKLLNLQFRSKALEHFRLPLAFAVFAPLTLVQR